MVGVSRFASNGYRGSRYRFALLYARMGLLSSSREPFYPPVRAQHQPRCREPLHAALNPPCLARALEDRTAPCDLLDPHRVRTL